MQTTKVIHVVSCHAEGEVGDVIVGGVAPPPGATIWEQSRWIAKDDTLRQFVLNEPRGGVFRHVNLLVPPKHAEADWGWIIMEPEDTPPMSGSNSICVATVLLDTGMLPMVEPQTRFTLEAPGGLVHVTANCHDNKAQSIQVRNVESFAHKLDVNLAVEGLGSLCVDTGYGGDSFVMVDADKLGFRLIPDEARTLAEMGVSITQAANEQIGFHHPLNPDWNHYSFCLFHAQTTFENDHITTRHAVSVRPGKIDRSPTGTAVSARMAVLKAKGQMQFGDQLVANSIIDSQFKGTIDDAKPIDGIECVSPTIAGRAWVTGTHQFMLDPSDPWPLGYRLKDTWGV